MSGTNKSFVISFGKDELLSTVLKETDIVLREKFFLNPEFGGIYNPPLEGKRGNQYMADAMLSYLVLIKPENAVAALGITGEDIYSPGLNFVFGLASPYFRAAVVSYARLIDPDQSLFISRVRKEVTHEMGHVFGLEHCPNPRCVMSFSNSLFEVDLKTENFCNECSKKLKENLKRLGIIKT
ncbi:MAG: archaemetzincin family Zn-dependent metalloprotease [Aquificae bacterium]|jgi:archaemetzincin|nr:archaemetzincin family Zn-dependent metalloprotease [Aquificota bacterium]